MDRLKLLLDTDIGDDIDDAFALALILKTKELNLLGVTTVYKNVLQRAKLAKYELSLLGRPDIPVHLGANKPLEREIIRWNYEHVGPDGLIDIAHYIPSKMEKEEPDGDDAVSYILDTIKKHPHEIVLVAIGPLTNVALAYQKDPKTFSMLKGLCLMAADYENQIPEWNVRVDPEAAEIVFHSGVPIRCVGCNVTRECRLTPEDVSEIASIKEPAVELCSEMLSIWLKDHPGRPGVMHDALAVAELTKRFCDYAECRVDIQPDGRSVPDTGKTGSHLATRVDDRAFIRYLIASIGGKENRL